MNSQEPRQPDSIPEEWLSAYLDNELDLEQRRSVERAVAEDPYYEQLLRDLKATRSLIQQLPSFPNSVTMHSSAPRDPQVAGLEDGLDATSSNGSVSATSLSDNSLTDGNDKQISEHLNVERGFEDLLQTKSSFGSGQWANWRTLAIAASVVGIGLVGSLAWWGITGGRVSSLAQGPATPGSREQLDQLADNESGPRSGASGSMPPSGIVGNPPPPMASTSAAAQPSVDIPTGRDESHFADLPQDPLARKLASEGTVGPSGVAAPAETNLSAQPDSSSVAGLAGSGLAAPMIATPTTDSPENRSNKLSSNSNEALLPHFEPNPSAGNDLARALDPRQLNNAPPAKDLGSSAGAAPGAPELSKPDQIASNSLQMRGLGGGIGGRGSPGGKSGFGNPADSRSIEPKKNFEQLPPPAQAEFNADKVAPAPRLAPPGGNAGSAEQSKGSADVSAKSLEARKQIPTKYTYARSSAWTDEMVKAELTLNSVLKPLKLVELVENKTVIQSGQNLSESVRTGVVRLSDEQRKALFEQAKNLQINPQPQEQAHTAHVLFLNRNELNQLLSFTNEKVNIFWIEPKGELTSDRCVLVVNPQ